MAATRSEPELRECHGCGLVQSIPAMIPGTAARCGRCDTVLRRAHRDPLERSLALNLAALILLVVVCTATLMTVEKAGITHSADLFSGPDELARRGMAILALAVVVTTAAAPLLRLLATLYVLAALHTSRPARHLARVFAWRQRLAPWAMIDVLVLGVFVAYVKLGDVVRISLETGVYALLVLMVVLVWADSVLDRQDVWHAIDRLVGPPDPAPEPIRAELSGRIGCQTCGWVVRAPEGSSCPRCLSQLHARKPQSIARTWALVIAAAILYLPANLYPVLTVQQLGAGAPSTILGGVRELIASRMYPLAALVFVASVAVPLLKIVGLAGMLVLTQRRRPEWIEDRTRLYHVVRWIGRWSMIDIFMESLLGALVHFGSVITIEPGMGATAFCGVVVLTMVAAETFDPRLMWDRARGFREAGAGRASTRPG